MKNVLYNYLAGEGYNCKYSARFGGYYIVLRLEPLRDCPIIGHHITVFSYISNFYKSKDSQYHYTVDFETKEKVRLFFNRNDEITLCDGGRFSDSKEREKNLQPGMELVLPKIKRYKENISKIVKDHEAILDAENIKLLQLSVFFPSSVNDWKHCASRVIGSCRDVLNICEDHSTFSFKFHSIVELFKSVEVDYPSVVILLRPVPLSTLSQLNSSQLEDVSRDDEVDSKKIEPIDEENAKPNP